MIKAVECATTECQPNENVEALRVFTLQKRGKYSVMRTLPTP